MIYIGTSGWVYKDWKGRFYPKGLPDKERLSFYGARFPTVEINNSFYRLPTEAAFKSWRAQTPPGFTFAVKASRFLTHIKRLKDPRDPVKLFMSRARLLGDRLGPVLYQLPPHFKADAERLRALLQTIPDSTLAAFEFRDPSWETDEVFEMLDRAGAALVMPDRPRLRIPGVITGDWAYIRFHQGSMIRPDYSTSKLKRWADRIAEMKARDVYVYFNNDTGGAAVRDAVKLMGLLDERGQRVAHAA